MPRFIYTAKSLKGEEKSGTLEAKDARQLAQILRQEGLILVRAESEEKETKKKLGFKLPFIGGVPLAEKMFFARNLQVMISAGSPLPKAIEILSLQVKSKKFKEALLDIKEEIVKGKSFSDCLANYPNIFSELFQNMIKVAEESGTMDEVLKTLALQMEKENELKSKVKGAMIYPAVIVFVMVAIGILMLITVVPQLAGTFKELGVDLPMTTKLIIGLAAFLVNKWYFLFLILFSFFFIFWQGLKSKSGKRILDTILLRAPIISPIIKKTNAASTVRNLSSLISAGVPLLRSLEIISGTLGNVHYKTAISDAVEKVKKGEKLSEALKNYQNVYPLTVIQMIAVGEETGETASVLKKLAEFYEEEVSNATQNLASVIEPVLMVVIGAVVGFFAVSMIQPMYSMLGSIE